MNAARTLPAKIEPASGFFGKGKALVKFYKTGITNVWHNRKIAAQIRANYGATDGFGLARSIVENTHLAHIKSNVSQTPQQTARVSRAELLTVLRTERDFYKLPMFCVVFAVCFEMTPAVLWAFPRLAPSTCYSVSNREARLADYRKIREALGKANEGADGSESVYRLSSSTLRQLARMLDFGWSYRYAPLSLLRSRMMKHITEVRADDIILRQEREKLGDLQGLELERALTARGLPTNGGVAALLDWIDDFKEPMDAGMFVHPSNPSETSET